MTDSIILLRKAGWAVLEGVRKDNASLVAAAASGDLAMADAIAMSGMPSSQGTHARLGLALVAIEADAPNALMGLLSSAAWLAARVGGASDEKSWELLCLEAAAKNKKAACAKIILSHWPSFAWPLAGLAVPAYDSRGGGGAAGWLDGLEMACAAMASEPSEREPLDARSTAIANQAVVAAHKSARAIPKSENAKRMLAAMRRPTEALLESGKLSYEAAKALMDSAIQPLPQQRETFNLAMSSWRADASLASLAGLVDRSDVGVARAKFSLDRRGQSSGLSATFPESVTVAWAAACNARALSISQSSISELFALASSMAAIHGSDGEQARMAPEISFVGAAPPHPLAGIWRHWNNSRRAGFAMSPAVLQKTQDAAQRQFERWRGLVDEVKIDEWRAVFASVLDKLLSGVVPEAFEGYPQEPSLQKESILPESAMSPLAWSMWLDDSLSAGDVAAIAVAQSAAGFSLKSSLLQISQMGSDMPPSHLAAAEAAILEASIMDQASLPTSARSMRI